jgi:hypothetical protein
MFFWMRRIAKGGDEATPSRIDSVDEPIEPAELETLNINHRWSWRKVSRKNIREKKRTVKDVDVVVGSWTTK